MSRLTSAVWALLLLVGAAAAILSFSSLTDLAERCGFSTGLSWLLPVVIDAGAGAGCLVWLGLRSTDRARRFARALTWTLLASSVLGNAVTHYLAAYHLAPPWWLVVAVSAVAPVVLGSIVHLAVLLGRGVPAPTAETVTAELVGDINPQLLEALLAEGVGRRRLASELGISEHAARQLLAARNGDNT